jgi:methionyl-tRNA formyltransferase
MQSSQFSSKREDDGITLFLMTEKGYDLLRDTARKYKHLFSLVVVGCDSNIENDFEAEIIDFCINEGIKSVRRRDFHRVASEYAIAVSWRWLIDHPPDKLIVFHDSLLPRYRGFSPLVNQLINGEKEIGVSAIFGDKAFDTGRVIFQSQSHIEYPMKIFDAMKINNANYLACANFVLDKISLSKALDSFSQDEGLATYSVWRDDEDYAIRWNDSASRIRRFIDAVGYPYRGAYTYYDKNKVIITSAEEVDDVTIENRDCGKVLFMDSGKPVVICGTGMLRINDGYTIKNREKIPFLPTPRFRIRFSTRRPPDIE